MVVAVVSVKDKQVQAVQVVPVEVEMENPMLDLLVLHKME